MMSELDELKAMFDEARHKASVAFDGAFVFSGVVILFLLEGRWLSLLIWFGLGWLVKATLMKVFFKK